MEGIFRLNKTHQNNQPSKFRTPSQWTNGRARLFVVFVRWCSSLLDLFYSIYQDVRVYIRVWSEDDKETVNSAGATIILRLCSVLREKASFCAGSRLPAVSQIRDWRPWCLSVQIEVDSEHILNCPHNEMKLKQNCFETVSFHFHFVVHVDSFTVSRLRVNTGHIWSSESAACCVLGENLPSGTSDCVVVSFDPWSVSE